MYPPTRRAIQLDAWDLAFICIDKQKFFILATSAATISSEKNKSR